MIARFTGTASIAFACARWTGGGPTTPRPRLVVPGAQLWHEVEIRGMGRQELLIGILSFLSSESFRLEAQTPFGVTVFKVGFDGRRFVHDLAPFLSDHLPGRLLARDIHRIYFGGCPEARASPRQCVQPDGARLSEHFTGDPPQLSIRTYRDVGGRKTTIRYRRWTRFGAIAHPRRIDLTSEGFTVSVALTNLRRMVDHPIPAGSAAARAVTSTR